MDGRDDLPILPAHIEETIRSIARLHAAHHQGATPLQRLADRLTRLVGQPRFVGVLTVLIALWVGFNLLAHWRGGTAFDPPPFNWLELLLTAVSLYMVVLILITQRRDDLLAQHREQLTLELSIVGEAKSAKIIALLEELRRDSLHVRDRHDPEAEAMSQPADPQSVLEAIKLSHAEAELAAGASPLDTPGI